MRACFAGLALAVLIGCGLKGPFAFLITGIPHELNVRTENEVFDPTSAPAGQSPWTTADPLPVETFPEAATVGAGQIYIHGDGTDTAFRFNPAAAAGSQWQTLPRLSVPRTGAVAAAVSTTVVVVSGLGPTGQPIPELEQIDGSTVATPSAWVQVSLPFSRTFVAAVSAEGNIYLFGGQDASHVASADAWIYDPVQKKVTALPAMSTPRIGAGAFVGGRQIHIVGGQGPSGFVLANEDVFDIAAATMTATPRAVPDLWFTPQIAVNGDEAVVIGSRTHKVGRSNIVDRYRVSTNTWANDIPYAATLEGVALATNRGQVVGAGGADGDELSTRDFFLLATTPPRSWLGGFTMPTKRHAAFAAEINGKTYVIGGVQVKETTKNKSFF